MPNRSPEAATLLIVSYHKPDQLARLLESCSEDALITTLVVNVEADPAVDEVAERHRANLIRLDGNPGYGAAINVGMQAVTTDVVIFSNDDVYCHQGTLRGLVDIVARGLADVAAPQVRDANGQTIRTIQAIPGFLAFIAEWLLLPDRPLRWMEHWLRVQKWRLPDERQVVQAVSAVLLATRADLLREIQVPDDYFMYFEESEWFLRLARAGRKTLYCPDLTITHEGGRGLVNEFKSSLQASNATLFMRRRYGAAALAAYPLVVMWQARLLATAMARRLAGRVPSSTVKARSAGLRAALASARYLR